MSMVIGLFEQETKVLKAIRQLREAGADNDGIRVAVKNRESAPLLADDGNVRLEALDELREVRGNDRVEDDDAWVLASAPLGFPVGNMTASGPTGVVLVAGYGSEDEFGSEEALYNIGVPDEAAKRCAQAINLGHYVLLAETDIEGNVASLLNEAGANVIH
ncbi:general stress protein [Cohnella mopanensis]|uniref:general stress protein n=1 Tax=Cohnella mopanensis TaxID=2911966 RepID=UPI001EF919FB|nr:general stress protein [Cohnella mopanensis]